MSQENVWTLSVSPSRDTWAFVPNVGESDSETEWRRAVARRVSAHGNAAGAPDFDAALDAVLREILERRSPRVMRQLVAWPSPSPMPACLSILLVDSADAGEGEPRGYTAHTYPESPFGAGVQFTRQTPGDPGGAAVDSVIVFDRGDVALWVYVHPMPALVYALLADDIVDVISSAALTAPDGSAFTVGSNAPRTLPEEQWPELVGRAQTIGEHG